MSQELEIKINRKDLNALLKTFSKLDKAANNDLKKATKEITKDVVREIKYSAAGAGSIGGNPRQAEAIATGIRALSGREAKIKISGTRPVVSGGGTVEDLLWGGEFGSTYFRQFPARTPKVGKGNRGYFIFPTLKRLQPKIRKDWIEAVNKIADIWKGTTRG